MLPDRFWAQINQNGGMTCQTIGHGEIHCVGVG